MEKENLSEKQDLNSIKLIRGQRKNYGFEIKLVGKDETDILKRLKIVDDELVKAYDAYDLNLQGDLHQFEKGNIFAKRSNSIKSKTEVNKCKQ